MTGINLLSAEPGISKLIKCLPGLSEEWITLSKG